MQSQKVCKTCGEMKDAAEFQRNRWNSAVTVSRCKACHSSSVVAGKSRGAPDGFKLCNGCQQVLPLDDFYVRKKRARGERRAPRPRCKACERQASKEFRERASTKDYFKDWKLRKSFGITLDDYQRLAEAQGGRCGICGRYPDPGTYLSVDHDHATGKVRGLLCRHCNLAVGKLGDNADGLLRALTYLSNPPAQTLDGKDVLNATT